MGRRRDAWMDEYETEKERKEEERNRLKSREGKEGRVAKKGTQTGERQGGEMERRMNGSGERKGRREEGLSRAEKGRIEQSRAEKGKTEYSREGKDWAEQRKR